MNGVKHLLNLVIFILNVMKFKPFKNKQVEENSLDRLGFITHPS